MPDLDYVQPGDSITFAAAPSALVAGEWLLVQELLGVVKESAASGAPYVLQVRGVFRNAPKATGQTWTAGEVLYWHPTNDNWTVTLTGAYQKGYAAADAASAAAIGTVLLTNQRGNTG